MIPLYTAVLLLCLKYIVVWYMCVYRAGWRSFFLKAMTLLIFLTLSIAGGSIARDLLAPFESAADTVYRGFQAFRMKQDGMTEDKVRASLIREPEIKIEADFLSMAIENSLSNFVDNIYGSKERDGRRIVHEFVQTVTSLTIRKYGKPNSLAEIRYATCLKMHNDRYTFAVALENQMKSTLNQHHLSINPDVAYSGYLDAYSSAVENSSLTVSILIIDGYFSCFKAVSVG